LVTVWRRARRGSSGFPVSHRGALIDSEFKYEPMGLHWKGTLSRNPISFELFDGVPHLVLYIRDRESCARKAPTDYTAEFLRWQSGEWKDVLQAEFPTNRALMNLSEAYFGGSKADDYKGLVVWEEKRLLGNRNPLDTVKSFFERSSRYCGEYSKI
jgi:hypothetical protein